MPILVVYKSEYVNLRNTELNPCLTMVANIRDRDSTKVQRKLSNIKTPLDN